MFFWVSLGGKNEHTSHMVQLFRSKVSVTFTCTAVVAKSTGRFGVVSKY